MNVLFVREYPLIDGTFTLILRLGRKMSADGFGVNFLFYDKSVDAILLSEISQFSTIYFHEDLEELKNKNDLPDIDVIHGILTAEVLYNAYSDLKRNYFQKAAIVIGIYHPRAFFTETFIGSTPDTKIHKLFFQSVPSENLLFMNEAVKQSHQKYFGVSFKNSSIIPIPVDIPNQIPYRTIRQKGKVVSIGRLVEFKNYVEPVIRTVVELNRKGYSFEYHIYGNGPLRVKVERLIGELQAERFIFLHGGLPYTEVKNVLTGANIFIGMGTAIIESSALGVPSLLAIESQDDKTYGWFYNQPGFEVGEQVTGRKEHPYEPFILEAFEATTQQYDEMCFKSWQKSKSFSLEIIIKDYYKFLEGADANFSFIVPKWRRLYIKFLRQLYKINVLIKKGYKHK